MPVYRKDSKSGKAFAGPLLGVVLLVACYFVLSEWQDLPKIISAAIVSVHWPG